MKISVVIPVHNGQRYITRCVDSILPQLTEDMELILVDDASSDSTLALLRERYGSDPKVLLAALTQNGGAAAARNVGIRLTRGEWVAFCDADDEWLPGYLPALLEYIRNNPSKEIFFSTCKAVLDETTDRTRQLAAYAETDLYHFRAACIRKTVFERIGLLDESMRTGEDREWLVRAKSRGIWGDLLEDAQYLRHIQEDGLSAKAPEEERAARTREAFMRGIRRDRYIDVPQYDLSILIPVYNAEKYVQEAVGTCLCTGHSYELILVEDGSSDESKAILCGMLARGEFPAPATVILRRHKGQASSRNDALRLARGKRILYLDADDHFLPGAVDVLMAAAETDSSCMLVSALCKDFISPELTEEEAAQLKIEPLPYRRMLAGCMLAKRELYDEIGPYDESLPSSETAQWVLRMRDAGVSVKEIEDVVLARRYHKTNLGRTNRQTQMNSYMAMIRSRLQKKPVPGSDNG